MKKAVIVTALVASVAFAVSSINLFGMKEVYADENIVYPKADVAIDEKNFPDENFRECVKKFDKDTDGFLSSDETAKVTSISCSDANIKSLKGVEFFTNLTSLNCAENDLVELDISNNFKLYELICSRNHIKTLDLSNNTQLVHLFCFINELETLDVSCTPELAELSCGDNQITDLDLSQLTHLYHLECDRNPLTQLDVSTCKGLGILTCGSCKLSALNLSENTSLWLLKCQYNELEVLDISRCMDLEELIAYSNKLDSIDIRSNPKLMSVVQTYERVIAKDEKGYEYYQYGEFDVLAYDCFTSLIGVDIPTPTPTATPTPTLTGSPAPTNVPTKAPTTTPTKVPTQNPAPTMQPTLTPTPAPSKGTIADFVERLYTVALGRPSEKEGKAYWVEEITSGNKTGADCGLFFLTSEEFNNRGLSIENFVETLYKTFFGRDSEPNGKAYWVGELKSGRKSRADVIWGFIDSKEWCNICADYGVKSGAPTAKADHASQNAIDFATRLYTCCLGRAPEEGGLKYWSLALTNLEQTGCTAAKEFFMSQEFINLKLKDDEYIRRLYTTFMGRDPEASEIAYWTGEIKKGTQTRYSIMQFFGQSPEFTEICKKYGIDRGTI